MPRAGLSRDAVIALAQAVADDAGPGGFDALTLAAVAARAGVAVPSLYKHVAGLPDLRREVALRAVEDFTTATRASVADRPPSDAVRAAARTIRAYALRHPARYAAVQAAPALGDLPDGRLGAASGRAVAVLAEALRTAADGWAAHDRDTPLSTAGVPDDAQVHLVRVVRAAVHGFVDLELRGGFGLPADRDTSFELLLDVLVSGLRVA